MPTETESDSATSEAGSGVGSRRTAANAERDSLFDRNNQDIDADAAYILAGLDQTRAWNANSKLTYDSVLEQLASQVKEAQTHITNVNAVRLQTLASMQANADALNKQHTAHRDIATDRTWTQTDELGIMSATAFAAVNAKSGVQADAFVALLAEAVAKRMGSS